MKTVSDLKAAPYNPRKISDPQLRALAKSIKKFGDLSPIIVNVRTGNVCGGHQRIKTLKPSWKIIKTPVKDKIGTVATGYIETDSGRLSYREVDWTETEEKAANLAANKHGGDWDFPKLKEILNELDKQGFDLDLTGFLSSERLEMGIPSMGTEDEDEPVPSLPAKPKSQRGDLYILGNHRLLCGDSTRDEDVKRLMGKERACMMWTDPPYGVEYVGKTKAKKTIRNDGQDGLESLLTHAFGMANEHALDDGAAIYVAHPAGAQSVVFGKCFLLFGWRLHETLIWVKDSMVLGHSDYHIKHESIIFGYKKGKGRIGRGGEGWYGNDKQTSVFEVPRPKSSQEHPTMKPVDLVMPMVSNSSPADSIVYEPFGGSGTTIIACERLKRNCYTIEIDPAYVDVIVERWEIETGKKAKLEEPE